MTHIAVAILPSNQDRNISPVWPGYTEMGGMFSMAPLVESACLTRGVNAHWFTTGPESSDTYPLQNLIDQQRRANEWLAAQSEEVRCLVNLHTDAGNGRSHTFAIYVSVTGQESLSRSLADAIGSRVHDVLQTEGYQVFQRLGTIDYNLYVFATHATLGYVPCLIELAAHDNLADMTNLAARELQAAEGIALGVVAFQEMLQGGLPPPPTAPERLPVVALAMGAILLLAAAAAATYNYGQGG